MKKFNSKILDLEARIAGIEAAIPSASKAEVLYLQGRLKRIKTELAAILRQPNRKHIVVTGGFKI
jgi:hypothetical protein